MLLRTGVANLHACVDVCCDRCFVLCGAQSLAARCTQLQCSAGIVRQCSMCAGCGSWSCSLPVCDPPCLSYVRVTDVWHLMHAGDVDIVEVRLATAGGGKEMAPLQLWTLPRHQRNTIPTPRAGADHQCACCVLALLPSTALVANVRIQRQLQAWPRLPPWAVGGQASASDE